MTAVEWVAEKFNLITWLSNRDEISIETALEMRKYYLEQAKQMEKEQLVKALDDVDYAYFYSKETGRDFDNGEQYYNETYGKP